MSDGNDAPASNTHLLGFVERLERLARQKATIAEMEKETIAEAKSVGYDAPTLKKVVKARILTAEQIEKASAAERERQALFEIYCASLGMLDGTPLGDAAREKLAKDMPPPPEPKKGRRKRPDYEVNDDPPEAVAEPPPAKLGPEEINAAREQGAQAHRDGVSVLKNPFVAGDPRRASWDEGWCSDAGSDGMDIPAAYRRNTKKKDDDAKPDDGKGGPAPGGPSP